MEEDAKAAKEIDSIANAADDFLNDTNAQDTVKKEERRKKKQLRSNSYFLTTLFTL